MAFDQHSAKNASIGPYCFSKRFSKELYFLNYCVYGDIYAFVHLR